MPSSAIDEMCCGPLCSSAKRELHRLPLPTLLHPGTVIAERSEADTPLFVHCTEVLGSIRYLCAANGAAELALAAVIRSRRTTLRGPGAWLRPPPQAVFVAGVSAVRALCCAVLPQLQLLRSQDIVSEAALHVASSAAPQFEARQGSGMAAGGGAAAARRGPEAV
jgi:hypothetical protein